MKIMIPESMNTTDKVTEEEDHQNPHMEMIDQYQNGMVMMNSDPSMIGQQHHMHHMDVDHHHGVYFYGQQDEVRSAPIVEDGHHQNYTHYLEIESHSHSEPARFSNTTHKRSHLEAPNNMYITHSYHNNPSSGSTHPSSDLHHDLLLNRLEEAAVGDKPHCQRTLDFFDFPHEM